MKAQYLWVDGVSNGDFNEYNMNMNSSNNDGSVGLNDFDLNGDLQITNSTFIDNDGSYWNHDDR